MGSKVVCGEKNPGFQNFNSLYIEDMGRGVNKLALDVTYFIASFTHTSLFLYFTLQYVLYVQYVQFAALVFAQTGSSSQQGYRKFKTVQYNRILNLKLSDEIREIS